MSDPTSDPSHGEGLFVEPMETFGPDDYRRTLGHFASGITVVTAAAGEERFGMTCQSFFALSLDPPLVAFSPARTSRSYPRIRDAGAFCVNVLADSQQALAHGFARSGVDKWADVGWRPGLTGSPVLDGTLAWLDCTLEAEHEAGDHLLVIGRVRALKENGGAPLLYYKGAFVTLAST